MRLAILFLLAHLVSGDPGGKARQVSYEVQSEIRSAIPLPNVSAAPSLVTVTTAKPKPTSEIELESNLSSTLNITATTLAESLTVSEMQAPTNTAETARPTLLTAPIGTPTATTNVADSESTEIDDTDSTVEMQSRDDTGGPRGKAGWSERASLSGRNSVTDSPTSSPSGDSTELANNDTSTPTALPNFADTNLTDALMEVVTAADGRFLNDSETAESRNVSYYCESSAQECANGGLCYTATDASRRCLCQGEWVGETCEELSIGGGADSCGANVQISTAIHIHTSLYVLSYHPIYFLACADRHQTSHADPKSNTN
jgi:hypothetical protein